MAYLDACVAQPPPETSAIVLKKLEEEKLMLQSPTKSTMDTFSPEKNSDQGIVDMIYSIYPFEFLESIEPPTKIRKCEKEASVVILNQDGNTLQNIIQAAKHI